MIADLHSRELAPSRWGNKASRLGHAARHSIAVPSGLCLDDVSAAAVFSEPHSSIVADWLTALGPPMVIVRSSSTREDGERSSAAGLYLTIRDVPPTVSAVSEAVIRVHRSLTRHGGRGAVIVQHQLPTELMGVTFTQSNDTSITEASHRAAAVTDGDAPSFRMVCRAGGFTISGDPLSLPPVRLARDLQHLIGQLRILYGFDLDIEWATVAGHPFLLQVRPVTVGVSTVE